MRKFSLLMVVVLFVTYGCKKDETKFYEPKPITALELAAKNEVTVGKSLSLELKIFPTDMNAAGELIWESSDPTIATVNGSTHTVKGLKVGQTVITVSVKENPSIKANCQLLVVDQVVTFDDEVFEKFILGTYDKNRDEKITGDEVNKITSLDLSDKGIKSLKGIEAFVALENLDVSKNAELKTLVLYKKTEVPAAKAEEQKAYTYDGATKLKTLNLSNTGVATIELAGCPLMEQLNLSATALEKIDLTPLVNAKTIDLSETAIAEVDFTQCALLEKVIGKYSALKFANLSNNEKMTGIDFTGNKALERVFLHQNTDPAGTWIVEQSTIIQKSTYDPREIIIPDANFKSYLLLRYDLNRDGKIYAEEAEKISGITINANIGSITGAEKFPNLFSILIKKTNQTIKTLDLTPYNGLVWFEAEKSSALKSVNFAQCTSLEVLIMPIDTKEVTINTLPKLTDFGITNPEKIEKLVISGAPKLSALLSEKADEQFLNNAININTLEITDCPALETLSLKRAPKLSKITLKLTGLRFAVIDKMVAESFDTKPLPALEMLVLTNASELRFLDLSTNTRLSRIEVTGSFIESLDLSKNTNLYVVNVSQNKLTALNTAPLTKLNTLYVSNNAIVNNREKTGLDVTKNKDLITLDFSNNKVETLDLSNHEWIRFLEGNGNPLTSVTILKGVKTYDFNLPQGTKIIEK